MLEYKDTLGLMLSDDWKKQLVAEYAQAEIRYRQLGNDLQTLDSSNMAYPRMDWDIRNQREQLVEYIGTLEIRLNTVFGKTDANYIKQEWLEWGEPLRIFDKPKLRPIKLKGNDNEVEWNESINSTGWFDQEEDIDKWGLTSPMYESHEEAVYAWNDMVSKMNGDK